MNRRTVGCASLLIWSAAPGSAAEPERARPVQLGADYTVDAVAVDAGDAGRDRYLLDNLNITADFDMDRLIGWQGGSAHVHVLNNFGGMPNNRAATVQGIDNIEVGSHRLRLFEAWVEQAIDTRTTARMGLYDVNSEFYSNDAAGTLIAPAFGIGSEIAATGPNGPSIFPSTALAIRLDRKIGAQGYVRGAIVNANARTIGDPRGVDTTFGNGGLVMIEAGVGQSGRIAVGGWSYTLQQDDVRMVRADGRPVRRAAHGGYATVQQPLNDQDGPWATQAFFRVGLSDGHTTPFRGGWQAGFLFARPIAGRPDGVLSLGANQAYLGRPYRQNLRDEGIETVRAESAVELTYADTIIPHVTVQPDVQWIVRPAGERTRDDVLVFTLRLGFSY